jgi:Spy/CpxP family protein refolding chaperone
MVRAFLLTSLLFTTMAFAQGGGGMGGGGMGGMGGGGMGEGGGGGRAGGLSVPNIGPSRMSRLDTMSGILKLTKDQKKEVKSIMEDGQKEAAPLRDELTRSREQIAEAVASGKSQDEINQAVKSYAELEGRMARIELDAFAKVYKLLDSEQQSKSAPVFQMMAGIFNNKNWNET